MQVKNQILIKKLEKTGFTDKEALVYVSLLELGGAFPSKIAEYTDLKRATVYFVLTALSVRGLVNEIERKNKLFYQIEKPEKILRYAQNKVSESENSLEKTKTLIPEITHLFELLKDHSKVTYYEGLDGLLSMYEDMISIKKPYEMLAFSKASELIPLVPDKFIKNYAKKKIELGITTKIFIPDTPENRKHLPIYPENTPKKFYPVIKYIAPEKFVFNGEIVIYGDSKIAITNFGENKLTGVIMEDKALNGMMRVIFDLTWDSRSVRD